MQLIKINTQHNTHLKQSAVRSHENEITWNTVIISSEFTWNTVTINSALTGNTIMISSALTYNMSLSVVHSPEILSAVRWGMCQNCLQDVHPQSSIYKTTYHASKDTYLAPASLSWQESITTHALSVSLVDRIIHGRDLAHRYLTWERDQVFIKTTQTLVFTVRAPTSIQTTKQ